MNRPRSAFPATIARSCVALTFLATLRFLEGANVVAIGDSLTAEYEAIPDLPNIPAEATAYAEVTVSGWESMSWVEVLAELRGDDFDFGENRKLPANWTIPRFSGFERNWAVPGIAAGQYEDFVTSTALSNFAYWSFRQELDEELRERADRVVIWLGANEFRGNYGRLYDGESGESLIDGLIDDLKRIVRYVKGKNPHLQIVLVNVPDLGATPDKQAAHPDPVKRARVTAAIEAANAGIAELAEEEEIAVADAYRQTQRLVQNEPRFFGAVEIINAEDEDNDPHYQFTRDGLHPNTASQIEIARLIIRAFKQGYGADIRQIKDAEALELLGINPNEPYLKWLENYTVSKRSFKHDGDEDGMSHLVEYAFSLNPSEPDRDQLPVSVDEPAPGDAGGRSVHYKPDPARARHVRVRVQYSSDGSTWTSVKQESVITHGDGSFTAQVPAEGLHLRLKVALIPPSGSTKNVLSSVPLQ